MKNIFNSIAIFACCLFMIAGVSCDQDNISTKYDLTNEAVSFLNSSCAIAVAADQTSVSYKIVRGNTNGSLELPIQATYNTDVFTLPTSVVFEDGSGEAILTIPLENAEIGITYAISLQFDSAKVSPSGFFKTTVNVKKEYIWEPYGTGQWLDGIIPAIFNVGADGVGPYPVELDKAEGLEVYRMKNPYGFGVYVYTAEDEPTRDPHYIIVDATNPSSVVLDGTAVGEGNGIIGIGIDWGYGEIMVKSMAGGTKDGKVITFKAGSTLACGMVTYTSGKVSWWCKKCELTLP